LSIFFILLGYRIFLNYRNYCTLPSKGYGRSVKEVFITISKTTAKISDEIEIEATTPVKLIIKKGRQRQQ